MPISRNLDTQLKSWQILICMGVQKHIGENKLRANDDDVISILGLIDEVGCQEKLLMFSYPFIWS